MAHKYGDLVAQYTETTGTGTYTLTTALANRRTFGAVLSNGDTTDYKVEGVDNSGNAAWEVGTGTYATSGTTLARTTIRASSTGSAINWGVGVKTVTLVQAAESMVTTTPTANRIKATGITPANGAIPIGNGTDFTVATLTGTANRVTVTNSSGGITLTCPQDIHTGAIVTFSQLKGVGNLANNATGQFVASGVTDSTLQTWLGMNTSANNGVLQSYKQGTGPLPLSVQPFGGNTSFGGAIYASSIGTTASAANAYIDAANSGNLLRSTSSMRYKPVSEPIDIGIAREAGPKLLEAMIWYRSNAPADNPFWSWYGLGAETVAEIDPRLVHWTYPASAYEDVVTGTEEEDVPVTEEVEETAAEIVVDEGRAVLRPVTRTVQRQIVDMLPVVTEDGDPVTDEAGAPLYHPVPRVEKVTREVTERRLKDGAEMIPDGVQYERVALILALYLADKIGAA